MTLAGREPRPPAAGSGKSTVAVVGRPNVGKSSLVNRLVGKRAAVVDEHAGVTRDRKALDVEWNGQQFSVVDTGGWLVGGDTLAKNVSAQAYRAVRRAEVIVFVVDATTGVTEEDEAVASLLRGQPTPVLLVANKVDSAEREADAWALVGLGLGDPWMVSAVHGRGTGDLLDEIARIVANTFTTEALRGPPGQAEWSDEQPSAAVGVVGRPNVGKSTLFNALVGADRSIVHEEPGTTRDSIDTVVETPAGRFKFIDTAGMRRPSKVGEGTEYYSVVRSLESVDKADVALLVLDATQGVTHQDQRLAERLEASGCAVVILLNKWECLGSEQRAQVTLDVEDRLGFIGYAPLLKISALTGLGTHRILPSINKALAAYRHRVPTSELNRVINEAQAAHPAPGARVLFAVQAATDPPTITLFANRSLPRPYLRYLEKVLRKRVFTGPTALKLRVRRRSS